MTVFAVMSIGEMGLGVGKLLKSHGYRVVTNVSGRSDRTAERARLAGIEDLKTDEEIVRQTDYFLSIAPPSNAMELAQRINTALKSISPPRETTLNYLDLNAISPMTVTNIARVFEADPLVTFFDGGIIGAPPSPIDGDRGSESSRQSWKKPSIPISGPNRLPVDVASILNMRHISEELGPASGLKMCFASLTKGFTALALQSFTAAQSLGVLPELKKELAERAPSLAARAAAGLTECPPKAYRWIREMEEIGKTFAAAGFGDEEDVCGGGLFRAVAEVYRFLAEDTPLSEGDDKKRLTADDVAKECCIVLKSNH